MKLSEIKNEQALELVADIIEPISAILTDEEIKSAFGAQLPKIKLVKLVCKKHTKEILEVLARLDGKEPDEYEISFLEIPVKVLELFNDPALAAVFTSQGASAD